MMLILRTRYSAVKQYLHDLWLSLQRITAMVAKTIAATIVSFSYLLCHGENYENIYEHTYINWLNLLNTKNVAEIFSGTWHRQ